MRKLIVLFIMLFCAAGAVQAQKGIVTKKTVQAITKNPGRGAAGIAGAKVPVKPGPKVTSVQAAKVPGGSIPTTPGTSGAVQVRPGATGIAQNVRVGTQAAQKATARVDEILAAVEKAQELQRKLWEESFQTGIGKSVLFIPNVALEKDPSILQENPQAVKGFSMTVVKSNYKGKTEIFGVIPTHSLPMNYENAESLFGVTKKFQAKVMLVDGSEKLIQGEVVQVSPRSMLDISLVKFNAQDEALLQPLEMSNSSTALHEPVFLYGNANGIEVSFDGEITKNSFISARTNMIKAPNGERQGFCGSPWLDAAGKVKAIHTGSVPEENVSHGTHVFFVKKLIEAYHNGGKATYDLMLDGQVLTTLNVDEYISAFAVTDEEFSPLYKEDGVGVGGWTPTGEEVHVFGKYAESRIRKAMKLPGAKYLILHSRTPYWDTMNNRKEPMLIEDRSIGTATDSNLREHVYDLEDKTLYWTTDVNEAGWNRIVFTQLDGMPIK